MKITLKAIAIVALPVCFVACKQKEKTPHEKFFPVVSFINSQVAHVDTSVYSIRKYVYIDSLHTDTSYIPREQFRAAAADFLSLPDISSTKFEDRFTEEKNFDETLQRVTLTYLPVNPEKEEIQREDVLIKPDPSGDIVSNIIINSYRESRDSSVEKKLLWQTDRSFQVTIIKQLPGQKETTTTFEVAWGESEQK
jgi:hypothetical protein